MWELLLCLAINAWSFRPNMSPYVSTSASTFYWCYSYSVILRFYLGLDSKILQWYSDVLWQFQAWNQSWRTISEHSCRWCANCWNLSTALGIFLNLLLLSLCSRTSRLHIGGLDKIWILMATWRRERLKNWPLYAVVSVCVSLLLFSTNDKCPSLSLCLLLRSLFLGKQSSTPSAFLLVQGMI